MKTFQPPALPLRVEVDHLTRFRIVEPGGRVIVSGHCSIQQAYMFANAQKMLDTLKKTHEQLVDWGKRNGMDFHLISSVRDAISAADPEWRA